MIENYLIHLGILVFIYIILAQSLNITLGFTGIINLGHIAFFGIGAYTSSLLTLNGFPWFFGFLSGGIVAALLGFLVVIGVSKLKELYLALATLGFNYVIYALILNLTSVTRGPLGLPSIPRPSFFGVTINSNLGYLVFSFVIMLLCIFIMYRLVKSPYGRLLEAVRDDEHGLQMLGKKTFLLKTQSIMVSAFFAGLAGSLFAHYINFIDPSSFYLLEIIFVFTIVIVGGIASFKGSIIATIILILLPELLRLLPLTASLLGPLRQIMYAVILLLVLIYRPRGLFGKVDLH